MKIDAHLEIVNNSVASHGLKGTSKPVLSQLSCSKDSSNKYFLIVNTVKKNSLVKYGILNNIEKVHCKFIDEGKATIKLKDPNVFLIIQKANPSQLKAFLKIIHLASSHQHEKELNSIKVDSVKKEYKQLKAPQTSLVAKTHKEFLVQKCSYSVAYSISLTKVIFTECKLKDVNKFIIALKNLVHLDLSQNEIECEIENFDFPQLMELNLSKNKIKSFGRRNSMPSLAQLDLSFNQIEVITVDFCRAFQNVLRLRLNNNQIKYVNSNFGYLLRSLKALYVSDNQLQYLPFSITKLRMEMIDVQNNQFELAPITKNLNLQFNFPKLAELCSRVVVNSRIKFSSIDIPATLIEDMKKRYQCVCGLCCFDYHFKMIIMFDMSKIAQTYSRPNLDSSLLPLMTYMCSWKCYKRNHNVRTLW